MTEEQLNQVYAKGGVQAVAREVAEECAKLCDGWRDGYGHRPDKAEGCDLCAVTIREFSEKSFG